MLSIFKVKTSMGYNYFASKRKAKIARERLIKSGFKTQINRGPDHWRGETNSK